MSQILECLPRVVKQTDDRLVVGKTQTDHNKRLKTVLDGLFQARVTLPYNKCCFSVEKVKFLGHITDKNDTCLDPSKTSDIKALIALCDISE